MSSGVSSRVGCLAAIAALLVSCAQGVLTPTLSLSPPAPQARQGRDTLKVHMRSGDLYMLSEWGVADSGKTITGSGTRFDAWRTAQPSGGVRLSVDSVALFETNSKDATFTLGLQGIGVMTILGAYISAVCLADPKSCFGSCPTFYVEGPDSARVQAEGFSASVARVLEATDVDALAPMRTSAREVVLHMRNEAWETHFVRSVNLLALARPKRGRVFAGIDSTFYSATHITAPTSCQAAEGSCLPMVFANDSIERFSRADSTDLAARETIELTFENPPARPGLILNSRNSLVTTYLFYQTMAYAGSSAASMVATMERGTRQGAESYFGMARAIGGIDVQVMDATGTWRTAGTFGEAGPIASDTKVVPLPASAGTSLRVRLSLARGAWRIGWIALANLGDPLVPTRIGPSSVRYNGKDDLRTVERLRDASAHVVSLPGDDYRLVFALPRSARDLELFVESTGYYYEWMRREWLDEENIPRALAIIADPQGALKQLAPAYAARESAMEKLFWSSRFNRRTDNADKR